MLTASFAAVLGTQTVRTQAAPAGIHISPSVPQKRRHAETAASQKGQVRVRTLCRRLRPIAGADFLQPLVRDLPRVRPFLPRGRLQKERRRRLQEETGEEVRRREISQAGMARRRRGCRRFDQVREAVHRRGVGLYKHFAGILRLHRSRAVQGALWVLAGRCEQFSGTRYEPHRRLCHRGRHCHRGTAKVALKHQPAASSSSSRS